jgi:hypothetical protein
MSAYSSEADEIFSAFCFGGVALAASKLTSFQTARKRHAERATAAKRPSRVEESLFVRRLMQVRALFSLTA